MKQDTLTNQQEVSAKIKRLIADKNDLESETFLDEDDFEYPEYDDSPYYF